MGLFSDNLDYKDFDGLTIKIKRTIGEATIELPICVEARISYVTWNNAKDITIDSITVKELKKNGNLLYAIKPTIEKYLADEINERSEYAEAIFPDDFFGEPKLEFCEKRAKELINSQLFKEALTKVDDPEGFDEVKFEKIYGIAPVGFKVWNVTSGVSVPYVYSGLVTVNAEAENTGEEVISDLKSPSINSTSELLVTELDKNQKETAPQKADEKEYNFNILSTEYEELKRKCDIQQVEIEKARRELAGRSRAKESLARTLSEKQLRFEQYERIPEQIAEVVTSIKNEASHITHLEKEKGALSKELEELQQMLLFKETVISIVAQKC
ncbi:MAG: hypothetical protein HDS78_03255 [Bacteroidales bacterium]|nr:hypothetical protein [Bacteroidales bacterium]